MALTPHYDDTLKQTYADSSDSGTISVPVGASGLFQTIIRNVIKGTEVVDEVLGTGDTVKTHFSGTLDHFPVGLRRLVVKYEIESTKYTAADDGTGVISGPHCTGTISHTDGEWELDFDSAPDSKDITADYLYGNPGQDWRECFFRNSRNEYWEDESFAAACKEAIYHNTGLSGKENVFIGFREWDYVGGSAYGIDLNGYIAYVKDQDWNANKLWHDNTTYTSTWKHWSTLPMLPLINDEMSFWIQSNQQRVMIQVKIGTHYEQAYLGFGNRFGTISQYPNPLIIKGATYGDMLYSSSDASHRMLAYNGDTASKGFALFVCGLDNSCLLGTYKYGSNTSYWYRDLALYPRENFKDTGLIISRTKGTNKVITCPVYVVRESMYGSQKSKEQALMTMDGVYLVFSEGKVAEDIVQFDGIDHIVFSDPVGTADCDFCCVSHKSSS